MKNFKCDEQRIVVTSIDDTMKNNAQARELVRHDGLKDLLTGLMSLPAFLDSVLREIKAAERIDKKVNLFMISLLEVTDSGRQVLAVRPSREINDRDEKELYDLAARVLTLSTSITQILRANDLIARYTFADILILTSGNYEEVIKKLNLVTEPLGATTIGIELANLNEFEKLDLRKSPSKLQLGESRSLSDHSTKSSSMQELLVGAIAQLESQLLVTFGSDPSSA